MSNLRYVTVVGRAGQDAAPDEKNPNVVRFGVAVNQWNPDTKAEETVWVNCSAWDRNADLAAAKVKKGARVWVTGKHSIFNGAKGEVDQLNVKSMGSADVFTTAEGDDPDGDEW